MIDPFRKMPPAGDRTEAKEAAAGPDPEGREPGDVAALALAAWVALAVGTERPARAALHARVVALAAELAGPDPSPVVRLLADRAALAWLVAAHADALAARQAGGGSAKLMAYAEGRATRASRRLQSALAAVAAARRLPRDPVRAPSLPPEGPDPARPGPPKGDPVPAGAPDPADPAPSAHAEVAPTPAAGRPRLAVAPGTSGGPSGPRGRR